MKTQTLEVAEDERQIILMALACLGKFRPGFREYLKAVAETLQGPGMFLDFEALVAHDFQLYGEAAIGTAFDGMREREQNPGWDQIEGLLLVAYRLDFAKWWAGRDRRREPRAEKA